MTSDVDSGRSTGDRRRAWAYHRDFWPGIVGYAVVLGAVTVWGGLDGGSPWRYVWAVLPVLPALLIVRAVVRHLRRIDEYERLLLLQGLGVGFAVAMITAMITGFLGVAGAAALGSGWIVFLAGMVAWALATGVLTRRAQRG